MALSEPVAPTAPTPEQTMRTLSLFLFGLAACTAPGGDASYTVPVDVPAPVEPEPVFVGSDVACELTCSGFGECVVVSEEARCVCDEGHGGVDCGECARGYHDDAGVCVPDASCPTPAEDHCAPHGFCSDAGGVARCVCGEGYGGVYCEDCVGGFHAEGERCVRDEFCPPPSLDPCAPHGSCNHASGRPVCECAFGYQGATCDECTTGFHAEGDRCVRDEHCPAPSQDPCAPHGYCDDSVGAAVCVCADGWGGATCDDAV